MKTLHTGYVYNRLNNVSLSMQMILSKGAPLLSKGWVKCSQIN